MDTISGYPLTWPGGWERTRSRNRASFGKTTVARATSQLLDELGRMKVPDYDVVVSTNVELRLDGLPYSNQRTPDDPAAAVWFTLKGEQRVLACDKWDRVEHNLRAIAKHIEALRGQARWGVGSLEQAFTGYKALPADTNGSVSWWKDLDFVEPPSVFDEVRSRYRELVKRAHPDRGGSASHFNRITSAYRRAEEVLAKGGAA